MADISMCRNESCVKKNKCHRYTARPDRYQSYFIVPEFDGLNCPEFWDNSGYPNERSDAE